MIGLPDSDGPDRSSASPRYVTAGQRGRGRVDRDHVRVQVSVHRQEVAHDLGLAAEAFGKEGPNGAVDHSPCQDLAVARSHLAPEEIGRDAAGWMEEEETEILWRYSSIQFRRHTASPAEHFCL